MLQIWLPWFLCEITVFIQNSSRLFRDRNKSQKLFCVCAEDTFQMGIKKMASNNKRIERVRIALSNSCLNIPVTTHKSQRGRATVISGNS